MKKIIARNIAIVAAVFIASFSLMLIVTYFQVNTPSPLASEVIETLKQLNDEHANNPQLQENIRQLDLLARKAYFIHHDRMMAGVYLLIAMLALFVGAVRIFLAEVKNVPDKALTPADDWAMKTVARRYVGLIAVALVVVALVFAALSSPFLRNIAADSSTSTLAETPAMATDVDSVASGDTSAVVNVSADENPPVAAVQEQKSAAAEPPAQSSAAPVTAGLPEERPDVPTVTPEVPKITANSFRGNTGNGTSSAKNIPLEWNLKTGANVAWHCAVPRRGFSSPVLNGGKIFVTGADEEARELYCFDFNTGKLLWTLAATGIAGSPKALPATSDDTGLAASTPATNGKQVCAIFATGDIICADMNGQKLWAKNLGVPENHYGYASSLLANGSTLFVEYINSKAPRILALDMATGAEKWSKTTTDKISWTSPSLTSVGGQSVLLVSGNPAITAYNAGSGEQLWRVEGLSGEVASSPCSANGVAFCAAEYAAVMAVSLATGEKLWTANDILPETASTAATADAVYVATSYGVLAAYDAKTGALRQQLELGGEFYSSPMLVDGKLILFSNSGTFHAFNLGAELTKLASFDTGEQTFATPAFADGCIIVRTAQNLYCVKK